MKYFEAVEVCPHCMGENVYPMWDVDANGFVAVCKHCGEQILLCDECMHHEDDLNCNCDWCKTECGGKCFRGETANNTFVCFDVACFDRTLIIKYPIGFDNRFEEIIGILEKAYDKWQCFEDIDDVVERDYVYCSCCEEFMVEELSKKFPEWIKWTSEYYGDDPDEIDSNGKWIKNKRR